MQTLMSAQATKECVAGDGVCAEGSRDERTERRQATISHACSPAAAASRCIADWLLGVISARAQQVTRSRQPYNTVWTSRQPGL